MLSVKHSLLPLASLNDVRIINIQISNVAFVFLSTLIALVIKIKIKTPIRIYIHITKVIFCPTTEKSNVWSANKERFMKLGRFNIEMSDY